MMSESHPDRSWYLLYTKVRCEQKAMAHLLEQSYEVYLPRLQYRKRRSGRLVSVTEPLFPRYLFIRLTEGLDNWAPIRSTPGVSRLVKFGSLPARVPDEFVTYLVNNEDETGLQQIESPHMEAGDRVRIIDGAMAGLEAVYQTAKSEERVMIMLKIAGKLARVELSREQLEKAT